MGKATAAMPARVCRDIRRGNAAYIDAEPTETGGPLRRPPNGFQMVRFLATTLVSWLSRQLASVFVCERWKGGLVDAPIHRFMDKDFTPQVRWLPRGKKSTYLADPFAVMRNGGLTILVEEFDYRSKKGRIAAVSVDGDRVTDSIVPVLDIDGHLSYPFTLTHAGRDFCIPESCGKREIALYALSDGGTRCTKERTLVADFAGIDPTVFRFEDRWWLFCMNGDDDPLTKLYVWHAEDLLGPWKPHTQNPVKIDVSCSRPAGTPFLHEGDLYRPTQDNSKTYGGAVVIARIERLTRDEFSERPVARVRPFAGSPYRDGLHTISSAGQMTIIDAKQHYVSPYLVTDRLLRKARKAAASLGFS